MTDEEASAAIDELLRGSGTWSDIHRKGKYETGNGPTIEIDGECTAVQLRAIADVLDRMDPPAPDPYRFSASFEVGGDDLPIAGTARDIVEKP